MADLSLITSENPQAEAPRLPALPAPELSVEYIARMKEILESLLGRRGNDFDRAVTFRDLFGQDGAALRIIQQQAGDTILLPAPGGSAGGATPAPAQLDQWLEKSDLLRALRRKIGSMEDLAGLPDEIRAQLALSLAEVARQRKADIRTVEQKIQTDRLSMASRLTELTASLQGVEAGVREFDAAYADTVRAVAIKVEQLSASLDGVGTAELEEQLLVIADKVDGLRSQYTLKVQTNPVNGQPPVIAGIALSAESPIAGPGTSSLIFMADMFAFLTGNGTVNPFSIIADDIVFNGNVRVNGTLLIDGGKLAADLAAPGTENSELTPALNAAATKGAALNADPAIENPSLWAITGNLTISTKDDGTKFFRSQAWALNGEAETAKLPIDPGKTYSLTADVYQDGFNDRYMFIFIQFFDADGDYLGNAGWGGGKSGYVYGGIPPAGWSRQGAQFGTGTTRLIPTNARQCSIGVWLNYDGSGATTTAVQGAQNIRLEIAQAWSEVAGPGKPQDNATVGAPAGTFVGGTEAGLVASRALNGDSAYNALPGITSAINDSLRKTNPADLEAAITLKTNGVLLAGTPTNGVYMTPTGIYCVQGGVIRVAIPISGDPTFAGQLIAAFGTFGAVSITDGGALQVGNRTWDSGTGIWFGFHGGVPKFVVGVAGGTELKWDGSALTIKNPSIDGLVVAPFTASISGTLYSTVGSGTQSYGSLTVTPGGNFQAPIAVRWTIGFESANGTTVNAFVSGSANNTSASFAGTATNERIQISILVQLVDAAGRVAFAERGHQATHGNFVLQ